MMTKNPMQLKAFIKNNAAEKHISAQLVMQNYMSTQRTFPLMIPVIPFKRLWTQSWRKRKASVWAGWQRRARLWRLGFSSGLSAR